MRKKLLCMEDLVEFFKASNLTKFSSSEFGYKLCVQVPSTFEVEEKDDDSDHRGMMRLKIRVFHLDRNRNGSFVPEKAAKDAMPTIKNRPIMAYIHQRDDGEWDFEAHNMTVETDEDGNDYIEYQEKQIGSFDESEPFFEYDKELDKTYVCAYAYVSEDYTRACDIIRRKGGSKNSCELCIEELAFNQKEKLLELQKFYVSASTLLGSLDDGTEVEEGMLGSRADIVDFSAQNNSVVFNQNNKLIETLDKLNDTLARFNINPVNNGECKEGGYLVNKFEELLKKYNKNAEDVTFEYENLADDELEAKFAEVFGDPTSEQNFEGEEGEDPTGAEPSEPTDPVIEPSEPTDPVIEPSEPTDPVVEPTGEDPTPPTDQEVADGVAATISALTNDSSAEDVATARAAYDALTETQKTLVSSDVLTALEAQETRIANEPSNDDKPKKKKYSVVRGEDTFDFAVSMSEVLSAISDLVNATYSETDNDWYMVDVYESEKSVVFVGCWTGAAYKQNYKVRNDVYSLVGDRVPVKCCYLTSDEEAELDKMRNNYSSIESKLAKYEAEPEKIAVLESDDYASIRESEEFAALREEKNHFDLSVDEVKGKLDEILLTYAKAGKLEFAVDDKKRYPTTKKLFTKNKNNKNNKSNRYGNLFAKNN